MTKTDMLVNAFVNGESLTASQIKSRYGITNVTATIRDLRAGLEIGRAHV